MNLIEKYKAITLIALLICSSPFLNAQKRQSPTKSKLPSHEAIFYEKMKLPIPPSVVASVLMYGQSFLGNAYPKSNIETSRRPDGKVQLQPISKEVLVVNLRLFDCVTFVENMIALAQTRRSAQPNFQYFKQNLAHIRYRNGEIDYAARLHYFSDWLFENEKRGILKIITKDIGGEIFNKNVFYMSFKKDTFYGNMADPPTYARVSKIEQDITQREKWYIPKERVADIEKSLKDGDIIGITNRTEGMDMAHAGIVLWQNGRAHLLHASSQFRQVVITDVPLVDYLLRNKLQTGIMVARLRE